MLCRRGGLLRGPLVGFVCLLSAVGGFVRVPKCNDKALELREDDADVVVTGIVRKVYGEFVGHSCAIEIVRVLKGTDVILALPNVTAPLYHRVVNVAGFGNPRICDNQVDTNDTRIFLLTHNSTSLLLNSSLVRISLGALQRTQAAITDGGVRDPCASMRCDFGSQCGVSIDGLSARCYCPERCDDLGDTAGVEGRGPVCGSDGKDYTSACELRRQGCLSLTSLQVAYQGKCDPCRGVTCGPYQSCKLTSGQKPVCSCAEPEERCLSSAGDGQVCGSDGVTYGSQCELMVAACKLGALGHLTVLHDGTCTTHTDPCEGIACMGGAVCVVSPHARTATCQCPQLCPFIDKPVCGSDNVTYENECHLKREACLTKKEVTVVANMACQDVISSCVGVVCQHGSECRPGTPAGPGVSASPFACVCPPCNDELDPVCGSNGVTFTNACHLKLANCLGSEVEVVQAHAGACDPCKDISCSYHAVCESRGGQPARCVCPTVCAKVIDPVCGSDGIMYDSPCELAVAACALQKSINVAAISFCLPPKVLEPCAKECLFGSECQAGKCECTVDPDCSSAPITPRCGSDGVTYNRPCELNAAICRKQEQIHVVTDGPCGAIAEIGSGDGSTQDGSDGDGSGDGFLPTPLPMPSDLVTPAARCNSFNCKFGGVCDFQDTPSGKCGCVFSTCDGYREKVCGSDGVIYQSLCELRLSSCRQQKAIDLKPLISCPDGLNVTNEPPCEGAIPLADASGRDLDCSPGKGKCPSKAYCHRNQNFAKCCATEPTGPQPCLKSEFGCCSDKKTASPGPRNAGCPSTCHCNPLGALRQTCDPATFQCDCKRGVGGQRCDSCQPGWWGLNRISEQQPGCEPCQCNIFGSQRQDCEQNTGKCLCHSFATGLKCDRCVTRGFELTTGGCKPFRGVSDNVTCASITCVFGVCSISRQNGRPFCSCDLACATPSHAICGSDGQTYNSECQMQEHGCQIQRNIAKVHDGPCKGQMLNDQAFFDDGETLTTLGRLATASSTPQPAKTASTISRTTAASPSTEPDPSTSDFEFEKDKSLSSSNGTVGKEETKLMTCDMDPCVNGICRTDSVFGFVCECFAGYAGVFCNEERPFTHPYFNGKSFLELVGLPGPERVVQIDMDILPTDQNGILLYAGNSFNGSGDYLSVVLKAGFIEFRFDNGHGGLVLRSSEALKLNEPHRLTVRKDGRDGMLLVDTNPPVYGSAPGSLTSLNVLPKVYLGHVSREMEPYLTGTGARLLQSTGTVQSGFIGCITSMESAGAFKRVYNLNYPSATTHVLRGLNIDQCQSDPCLEKPCINGGVCKTLQSGTYHCTCPRGFHGVNCAAKTKKTRHVLSGLRQQLSADVPQFNGRSYIKQSVETSLSTDFFVELWFRTFKSEGTLLWTAQNGKLTNVDFFHVFIEGNRVHLSMDVGNGRVSLRSNQVLLEDYSWHTVKVRRDGRKVTMLVDDDDFVTVTDKGRFVQLNVDNSIYIGGIPNSSRPGLSGAVQRLIVNSETFEDLLHEADIALGAEVYRGPPCYPSPCPAGSVCLPLLREFRCIYP